jgi:hypothetical protein
MVLLRMRRSETGRSSKVVPIWNADDDDDDDDAVAAGAGNSPL